MANLSWQYYKGYYQGFEKLTFEDRNKKTQEFKGWENIKSKDKDQEKAIEKFFKGKNQHFLDFTPSKQLPDNNQIQLWTTYPGLLMGSGYTHGIGAIGEFKIGFHLDYTTGLPIIPGSSIKGLLRSGFPQWEEEERGEYDILLKRVKTCWIKALIDNKKIEDIIFTHELGNEIHDLEMHIFEGIKDLSKEKVKDKYYPLYERDIFHDAYPIESKNEGNKIFGTDSLTPHGDNPLKNPTPLLFLKVLPQVCFEFRFTFGENEKLSAEKRKDLFRKILLTLGIGAKTNVGYGQLKDLNQTNKGGSQGARANVNYKIGTIKSLQNNDIVRATVSLTGDTIRMKLLDITDATKSIPIAKNRGINYKIGDIYEVKVQKVRGEINRIEHTPHIDPL